MRTLAELCLYDRKALKAGIIHLGIGAFSRAHLAAYTHKCIASGDERWGIVGVSLKRPDVRNALAAQDGAYSLIERDAAGHTVCVIGSVIRVLVAPENPQAVLDALCGPDAHIVSLTVTEKGYCLDANGQLDLSHPDIAHDLNFPQTPCSAIGLIAAASALREQKKLHPLSVLSCDNLRSNGHTLRMAVLLFAQQAWPQCYETIAQNVPFPCSMVDRIVPAMQAIDRQDAKSAHGMDDAAPVRCEPFSQWVIEPFEGERPAWGQFGVQYASNVKPFEEAKLRLLNAAHTALACIGALHGHLTIAAAAQDEKIAAFVHDLMQNELSPQVQKAPGLDLDAYQKQLWQRFRNPALGHGTHQVASDSSIKITQRHLPAIRERLNANLPISSLCTVISAWGMYLRGRSLQGEIYPVNDPQAKALIAALQMVDSSADSSADSPEQWLAQLLAHAPLKGEFSQSRAFVQALAAAFKHPLLQRFSFYPL